MRVNKLVHKMCFYLGASAQGKNNLASPVLMFNVSQLLVTRWFSGKHYA
jgi:hypothetical protein